MYGLLVRNENINDILNGEITFDPRVNPTDKRGRIGIIDKDTMKIYGYVNLIGMHTISYLNFLLCHINEEFNEEVVAAFFRMGENENLFPDCAYAYDFIDPEWLPIPVYVNVNEKDKNWVDFNDEEVYQNKGYVQQSLF